ncbi:MAG: HPr family phosphocarrier protein [Treponema sp.]|jgi:phosphotransferase system HPr (HPr) family protein|nr:HPr family phosphocarrier protein [Treponema sp.]
MIVKEFEIKNETGLHTRPGNEFVKTAKSFSCSISVTKGEKTVDAKSLLKLMKANVVKGDRIILHCEGADEEAAMDALSSCLENLKE